MSAQAKAFVEKVRAIKAGEVTATQSGVPAMLEERINELSEKEIGILEELYDTITESPIFGANKFATMVLTIQVVGKLNPEMVKSALSEMDYMRSSGGAREPDIKLDGARLFYKRGQAAFKLEEFRKAKNYFARSVDIAPHFKEGWFALAGTCELLGLSDEATNAFDKANELAK